MSSKLLPKSIFFLLTFSLAFYLGTKYNPNPPETSPTKEYRNSQNYQLINPLLECDTSDNSPNFQLQSLKKILNQEIINQQKQSNLTHVSLYYRDLNNGPWLGINENSLFTLASLIKVPIMIATFKQAENNPLLLDQKILAPPSFSNQEQYLAPSLTLTPNQEYSLLELVERMIIYSDNRAKDLILQQIGDDSVLQVFSDLGLDTQKIIDQTDNNTISVRDYSSFFRILYNSSYLNKDMSEKALKILSRVKYDQGLNQLLPKDITVSHKFGERYYYNSQEKQLHDCGIIYQPQHPYLLCIMTQGDDYQKLSAAISQLSFLLFNQLQP